VRPVARRRGPRLRGQRDLERHRHRYEVNQEFLQPLDAGLSFTGMSPDRKFVEIIELHDEHPWFLGCQFHPELKSKPFAATRCSGTSSGRPCAPGRDAGETVQQAEQPAPVTEELA
jgi:hypothetical protein